MDYVVDSDVLENYFREDNNYEPEEEKRDDQKEVTNKDEAEDGEYENVREQQREQHDYEEEAYNNEQTEWNAAEEEMFRTYFSTCSWVDDSDSNSTESNICDEEQTARRRYITKIEKKQIDTHEKQFDTSSDDESETEFIEKSEIEASEKSMKLEPTNPDLL